MNIEQKINNILDKWEGTRMIEKHFGEPEELLKELRELIKKEFPEEEQFKEVLKKIRFKDKTFKHVARSLIWPDYEDTHLEIYELNPSNWPNDEDDEPIDLENHEILEITDDYLILIAGGDWQQPCKMKIQLVDGDLQVTESTQDFEWQDGLTNEQIINSLLNDPFK